jgi:hypothetical protein
MADEQLTVSTTTDSAAVAEAVAHGGPEGGRALVHESALRDFSESESADGRSRTLIYTNPESESAKLLQQLEEAEKAVELPEAPVEQDQVADESGIDMQAIREAATRDALEDARRLHRATYYQQAQQPAPQAELERLRTELTQDFARRMDAIKPANFDQVMQAAAQDGYDITPEIRDALLMLPSGERVAMYLLEHPEERRYLSSWTDTDAVTRTAILASSLASPPRRQRSSAPLPISPVGGSSTRSSLPPDELPYQDFVRMRERQIKARRVR